MTNEFLYLLCLLSGIIKLSSSQYLPTILSNKSPCDDDNKYQMEEQFFNVIFTEFQHTPPVCVCVQMCANHPTYCYPNGCLKSDTKKKVNSSPVTQIHHDTASKTMFLVDEKNNFAQILNGRIDENNQNQVQTSTSSGNFFSDPLKDMYKTFFKYKKRPKVELRYNLREQVKNMKSDILKLDNDDISKTRRPKFRVFHDQKISTDNLRKSPDSATFFFSKPGISPNSYKSRYFKRELRRNDQVDIDRFKDNPDVLEKDFSIESLIENLIGNSFVSQNDTKVDISQDINVAGAENNLVSQTKNTTENAIDSKNINRLEKVFVVTTENKDENKYLGESLAEEVYKKWSNYTFDEMISELSKQIDINNNTGLDMMKNVSGDGQVTMNSEVVVKVEIDKQDDLKMNDHTIDNPLKYNSSTVTTKVNLKAEINK